MATLCFLGKNPKICLPASLLRHKVHLPDWVGLRLSEETIAGNITDLHFQAYSLSSSEYLDVDPRNGSSSISSSHWSQPQSAHSALTNSLILDVLTSSPDSFSSSLAQPQKHTSKSGLLALTIDGCTPGCDCWHLLCPLQSALSGDWLLCPEKRCNF